MTIYSKRPQHSANSFSNVAAGSTANLSLDSEGTYFSLIVQYKANGSYANQATCEADLTKIRVSLGSTVQREFSAAELIKMNTIKGEPFVDGFLTIPLAELYRQDELSEDATSWGMADVRNFDIHIDIAGAAVSPELSMLYEWQPSVQNNGRITTTRRLTVEPTASGKKTVKVPFSTFGVNDGNAQRSAYRLIQSMFLMSNTINSVKVLQGDTVLVRDMTKKEADFLLDRRGLGTDANVFVVSPELSSLRLGESFANTARDADSAHLVLELDLSAATNFDILIEDLGPRKG